MYIYNMAEEEIDKSELEVRANEIAEGRTGETIPDNENALESPLEQVKRINKETNDMLKKITDERKALEKTMAEQMIGGKSFGGKEKEKTQDEKDQEEADKLISIFS